MVEIVTGPLGCGKTSLLRALWMDASVSDARGWAGFLSVACEEAGEVTGYDAFCLARRRTHPLLHRSPARATEGAKADAAGAFAVVSGAFEALTAWVETCLLGGCRALVIDEVGPLELRGAGWAPALRYALEHVERTALLLGVRESCIDEVRAVFGLSRVRLIRIPEVLARSLDLVRSIGAAGPEELGKLVGGGAHSGGLLGALLAAQGLLREEGGAFHPANVPPQLNLSPMGRRLLSELRAAGEAGLDPRDAVGPGGAAEAERLLRLGLALELGRRFVSVEAGSSLAERFLLALGKEPGFSIARARQESSLTRSELLAFLELLERAGGIHREGDVRRVVRVPTAADLVRVSRPLRHDGGNRRGRRRRGSRR